MAGDQWKRFGRRRNKEENSLSKNRQLVQDLISTNQFRAFVFTALIFNTVLVAMVSPQYTRLWLSALLDLCTLGFFLEMVLKMYALKLAYFDRPWNLLDFATVVASMGELIYFLGKMAIGTQYDARSSLLVNYFGLARVPRLLAPEHHFLGLPAGSAWRVCRALVAGGRRIGPLLLMAGCLYALLAVYALNSWQGLLTHRCMDDATGEVYTSLLCACAWGPVASHIDNAPEGNPGSCDFWQLDYGSFVCDEGFSCVDTYANPNLGGTSFDNFLMAYLTVFQITTLGGWKDVLWYTQATLSWTQFFVFIPAVFLGSFMVVNIITAAIAIEFNRGMNMEEQEQCAEEDGKPSAGEKRSSIFMPPELTPPPSPRPAARPGLQTAPHANGTLPMPPVLLARLNSVKVFWKARPYLLRSPAQKHMDELSSALEHEQAAIQLSAADIRSRLEALHQLYREDAKKLERTKALEQRIKLKAQHFFEMAPGAVRRVLTKFWHGIGTESLRKGCIDHDSAFNFTINGLIVLNIICLAIDGYSISDSTRRILTIMDTVTLCIFTYEMGLKLLVLGIHGYCSRYENVFDASMVLMSWPMVLVTSKGHGFIVIYRIVVRLLKMSRIAHLYRQYPALQRMLQITGGSLQNLIPVCFILLLHTFIMAVLGVQIFGSTLTGDPEEINEIGSMMRYSFKNVLWAWMTIYYVVVGENWQSVLYIGMNKVSKWTALYFVFVVITGTYVGLNLLTAVVLNCVSANHAAARLGRRLAVSCNHAMRRVYLRRGLDRLRAAAAAAAAAAGERGPTSPRYCVRPHAGGGAYLRKYNRRKTHGALSIIHGTMKRAPRVYDLPFDFTNLMDELVGTNIPEKTPVPKTHYNSARVMLHALNTASGGRMIIHKYQKLCQYLSKDEKAKSITDRVAIILILFIWASMFLEHRTTVIWCLEMAITSFFLAEVIWKSTANGFLKGSHAYVKNNWNLLDLFIVLVSFAELFCYQLIVKEVSEAEMEGWVVRFQSVLLVAKSLRPLRLVVRLKEARRTVDALLLSLRPLGALLLMLVLGWALYAIVGLQLFSGLFYWCSDKDFPEGTSLELCTDDNDRGNGGGTVVERSALHFDDFFSSMGAVFVQATLIGWQPILFDAMDATSAGISPKIYNSPGYFIYFFIGTFLFGIMAVNLLVGAVFDSFIQMKEKLSGKDFGLDLEQRKLRAHEEHLMNLRPIVRDVQVERNLRRLVQKLVNARWFKYKLVSLVVVTQLIVLCATHANQPSWFSFWQTVFSHCVAAFLVVETCLKLYGHGVEAYFSRNSNIFDLVVSFIGLLDLVLFPHGCGSATNIFIRLRPLRVFRLYTLLSHNKNLHFLKVVLVPLPAMMSVLLLMSYVAFFYANLGVQLYSGVDFIQDDRFGVTSYTSYRHTDFKTLPHAFQLMTILATGDSWTDFLIKVLENDETVNYHVTYFFFGTYFVIQVWIMVNMFVLFIVENLELMTSEDIQRRQAIINTFQRAWAKYDPKGTGRLRRADLPALLVDVPAPLGVARDDPYLTLAKTVDRIECQPCFFKDDKGSMEIKDHLGFNDVLVSLCAIAFHPLKIVANDVPDLKLLFRTSIAEQTIRYFLKKCIARHRNKGCSSNSRMLTTNGKSNGLTGNIGQVRDDKLIFKAVVSPAAQPHKSSSSSMQGGHR